MSGSSDTTVFEVCRNEQRALVTFDLDFANPIVYDPRLTAGIAGLRLPKNPGPSDVATAVATVITALETHAIGGALWIVRAGRIRVWQPAD